MEESRCEDLRKRIEYWTPRYPGKWLVIEVDNVDYENCLIYAAESSKEARKWIKDMGKPKNIDYDQAPGAPEGTYPYAWCKILSKDQVIQKIIEKYTFKRELIVAKYFLLNLDSPVDPGDNIQFERYDVLASEARTRSNILPNQAVCQHTDKGDLRCTIVQRHQSHTIQISSDRLNPPKAATEMKDNRFERVVDYYRRYYPNQWVIFSRNERGYYTILSLHQSENEASNRFSESPNRANLVIWRLEPLPVDNTYAKNPIMNEVEAREKFIRYFNYWDRAQFDLHLVFNLDAPVQSALLSCGNSLCWASDLVKSQKAAYPNQAFGYRSQDDRIHYNLFLGEKVISSELPSDRPQSQNDKPSNSAAPIESQKLTPQPVKIEKVESAPQAKEDILHAALMNMFDMCKKEFPGHYVLYSMALSPLEFLIDAQPDRSILEEKINKIYEKKYSDLHITYIPRN